MTTVEIANTNTNTSTTPTPTPETASKRRKAPAAPTAAVSFPYTILEVGTRTAANVDPKSLLIAPFDSRSDVGAKLDPEFVKDVKEHGILQPVLTIRVRDEKGVESDMLIAGRMRLQAALENNLKTIPIHSKTMTLEEAVIACGIENLKRKSLCFWDEACYMKMLRDEYGLKQTQIKEKLGISDAKVSQALAVFTLDERVQKLVRKGSLEPGTNTKVRSLKALEDGDDQYSLAVKAIEGEWTSDDIDEAVTRLEAKRSAQAAAAEARAKGKEEGDDAGDGGGAPRGPKASFDPKAVSPIKKADFIALLEGVTAKIEKMRSKDNVDPEKLAFERGKLEGLKLGTSLKALPKSIASDE